MEDHFHRPTRLGDRCSLIVRIASKIELGHHNHDELGHWDTWEDEAIIQDEINGLSARLETLHQLDHQGRFRWRGLFTAARGRVDGAYTCENGSFRPRRTKGRIDLRRRSANSRH